MTGLMHIFMHTQACSASCDSLMIERPGVRRVPPRHAPIVSITIAFYFYSALVLVLNKTHQQWTPIGCPALNAAVTPAPAVYCDAIRATILLHCLLGGSKYASYTCDPTQMSRHSPVLPFAFNFANVAASRQALLLVSDVKRQTHSVGSLARLPPFALLRCHLCHFFSKASISSLCVQQRATLTNIKRVLDPAQ